ncbi:MAG: hypothetical protein AB4372_24835 [Xenococcus sp. (in: cyanobacteria)]
MIRVESRRITRTTDKTETRYYISDLTETAEQFAQRIRGYWGVENKVPDCSRCNSRGRSVSNSYNSSATDFGDRS